MPQAALNALLTSYRAQAQWLLDRAHELETGQRRVMSGDVDLSHETAAEYHHKALNLMAQISAYERLSARDLQRNSQPT